MSRASVESTMQCYDGLGAGLLELFLKLSPQVALKWYIVKGVLAYSLAYSGERNGKLALTIIKPYENGFTNPYQHFKL